MGILDALESVEKDIIEQEILEAERQKNIHPQGDPIDDDKFRITIYEPGLQPVTKNNIGLHECECVINYLRSEYG